MIKHDLILTIVNRGFADEVMSAAKASSETDERARFIEHLSLCERRFHGNLGARIRLLP